MSERVLVLNVKKKYFDQVKEGIKKEEYRLATEYWKARLLNKHYDEISYRCGYPKSDDKEKILTFSFNGFYNTSIIHKEWNNEEQEVFAIPLTPTNIKE